MKSRRRMPYPRFRDYADSAFFTAGIYDRWNGVGRQLRSGNPEQVMSGFGQNANSREFRAKSAFPPTPDIALMLRHRANYLALLILFQLVQQYVLDIGRY